MIDLFQLFADNILPIIIVAGVGFALQRLLSIDPRPISVLVFYALSPCLVFNLIAKSSFGLDEILRMAGFAALIIAVMGTIAWLLAKFLKVGARITAAIILTVAFMNAGNYGLSASQFAFGETGLAWASLFFVTSALLMNSAGVFVASAGGTSIRRALLSLLKVPTVYAIPLGLIVRVQGWNLPLAVERPIDLLSAATIPVMLLVLGLQISRAGIPKRKGLLAAAVGLRLVVSPIIAILLAPAVGLSGLSLQAGVLEAAMPSAVLTIIISLEFDVEPEFVTGAVLLSTLLSPLTITPVLALLTG